MEHMESKHICLIFISAWIGISIATSIGIYFTQSPFCLLIMLIPTNLITKLKNNKDEGNKDEHDAI